MAKQGNCVTVRDSILEIQNILNQSGMDPYVERTLKKILASSDPYMGVKVVGKTPYTKFVDVSFEVWSNSILSGPITHGVNIASNFLNVLWAPTEKFSTSLTALARADVAAARGNFGQGLAMMQGMGVGIVDAYRYLARNVPHAGGKTLDELGLPKDARGAHELAGYRKNKAFTSAELGVNGNLGSAVDFIGRLIRIPGAALVEEDIAFKIIHYRMQTGAMAVERAMNTAIAPGPLESMRRRALYHKYRFNPQTSEDVQQAVDMAKYYTFTNELGKYGSLGRTVLDKTPYGRFLIPFYNTPLNIAKMGARNSFVGAVYRDVLGIGAEEGATVWKNGPKGDVARARVAVSAGIVYGLNSIWGDNITGHIDQSTPTGRHYAQENKPPYSIEYAPGKWVSYEKIEPLKSILGMMVNYREALTAVSLEDENGIPHGNQELAEEMFAVAIAPFFQTVGDSFMIESIGGIMDLVEMSTIGNPDEFLKTWNRVTSGMLVPNLLRQANYTFSDNVMRATNGFFDKIKQGIPGLSSSLPARLTFYGDEQIYPPGIGPDFISPIRTMSVEEDYYDKEIHRLGITIPGLPKGMAKGGLPGEIELDTWQQHKFALARGKGIDPGEPSFKDNLIDMIDDLDADGATDFEKKEAIQKAFNDADTKARDWFKNTDEQFLQDYEEALEYYLLKQAEPIQ